MYKNHFVSNSETTIHINFFSCPLLERDDNDVSHKDLFMSLVKSSVPRVYPCVAYDRSRGQKDFTFPFYIAVFSSKTCLLESALKIQELSLDNQYIRCLFSSFQRYCEALFTKRRIRLTIKYMYYVIGLRNYPYVQSGSCKNAI